ncbi:MAG: class I SAM-dependent methyltransferase [Phycisphaerales bacterium]|nr:class I SAM-dependent methyltransferase [Phycisphaerales bacterium]
MSQRSVEARDPARREEVALLARRAGAVSGDGPIQAGEYRIVLFEDREELWDAANRRRGMPLSFRSLDRRTGAGNLSRKQPLGKAIGGDSTTVIDATAGLGHDAALLACMGWNVTAIERDPFIATMLELSKEDAARDPDLWEILASGLSVCRGDAAEMLGELSADTVYLDPMFTARRKSSALPKKPAQVLQALASESDDAALLHAGLKAAPRVVVKRPSDGPPILESPDLVFAGRLVRYDVYLASGSHLSRE